MIRPAPHGLGQNPALVIADIARRRADQTADRVFLHEFRHVDAHHRVVIVKKILGHGLGQFGFPNPGWPEEEERPKRAVFIIQARPRPANGIGDSRQRLTLADHAAAKLFFHAQQLFALAFQHLGGGDPCPAFDHFGDLFGAHRLGHQRFAFAGLRLGQLLFQPRNDAVGKLARAGKVALALCPVQIGARPVQLFLQLPRGLQLIALILPFCGQAVGLLLEVGEFQFQLFQTVAARCIVLFLQGFGLDLQLQDLAVQRVEFFGLAVHFHAQTACGLVHQINRLIRQEPVGDVAMAQRGRRHKRRIRDPHTMVQLILLLDAPQDRDRVFHRRLCHHHWLKAAGEGGVFLHIFAVFIQRGGANAMQLPPCKGGFDQVRGIHRAIRFARANQRVHLVDEQDDLARGGFDFLQDRFQTFFKLTTILRPGDQRAHIQRHQLFVAQ